MYVEYNSNNSGGTWWLSDKDWEALEAAGWKVKWSSLEFLYDNKGNYVCEEDGTPKLVPVNSLGDQGKRQSWATVDKNGVYRWLGALARTAYRVGLDLRGAVDEWERVTGECATDAGCPCCGVPHTFTEYDDRGEYVSSGPKASYSAGW